MIIAIDGPAGSGKSTIARIIARRLNFMHIETGAMYRSVAWKCLQEGVPLKDEKTVADVARKVNIQLVPGSEGQSVHVDGRDVTELLKAQTVSAGAAIVAAQQVVRDVLTEKQRGLGQQGNVVMDGRDIGSVVFPEADLKFFLDADPEERGHRRYQELKVKDPTVDLDTIIEQVRQRDYDDRNRKISPLVEAEDAIRIDTTRLNIDQVVEEVMQKITPSHKD